MSDTVKSPTPADANGASESTTTTATPVVEVTFTEREEKILKVAWQCLKSGPPEIDLEKLTKLGGFNTQKVNQCPPPSLEG